MSVINNIPLLIPDRVIVDTLNAVLSILRKDYTDQLSLNHEDESLLYLMLNGVSIGKYDLYKNAKEIFITTPQHPKNLDVKLSFDHTSNQTFPAIVVTLPSENTANNSIGIGSGDQEELIIARTAPKTDEWKEQFNRTYLATYHIVIVTENRNEMLVIYNVLKNMIVACTNHFAMEGLLNLKVGGQDLARMSDIPDKYFKRAITMSFQYSQVAPSLVLKDIFRKVRIYWLPEGSTVRQGPIQISNVDDIDSSS